MVTVFGGLSPIRVFPVGASFFVVVCITEWLIFIGPKSLSVLGCLFEKKLFFPSVPVESGTKEKGRRVAPKLFMFGISQIGWEMGYSSSPSNEN